MQPGWRPVSGKKMPRGTLLRILNMDGISDPSSLSPFPLTLTFCYGYSVPLEIHTEVCRVNDPNLLLILQLTYVCSNS